MRRTTLTTAQGRYCLLDLNQTLSLASRWQLDLAQAAHQQLINDWLASVVKAVPQTYSGVIAEPVYSLPVLAAHPVKAGLALSLNNPTLAQDPLSVPNLLPDWGVEAIANNYAVAELEMWYHPKEEHALTKKQFVAEVADYCHHEGIDLLLKLHWFELGQNPETEANQNQDLRLQAIQELRPSCQLLALDFPIDSLFAATVTAELDLPWLVLLGEMEYGVAKETLRQALESGAAGCVVSGALWSDKFPQVQKPEERPTAIPEWWATEVRDRSLELARIVAEHALTTDGPLTWTDQ